MENENKRKFISWRRVSTKKQGKSGLGLEAQKDIIDYFVKAENGILIADYEEVYTGKELSGCVRLRDAMEHCKRENSTLIIAKTDRFRNTMEALQIYDTMQGNIYFCDLPSTDKFTLTLFFSLAEREALQVSIRTKAALKVLKDKGVKLGAPTNDNIKKAQAKSKIAKREQSDKEETNIFFRNYISLFEQRNKMTFRYGIDYKYYDMLADELNRLGRKTKSGLIYTAKRCRSLVVWLKKKDGLWQDCLGSEIV